MATVGSNVVQEADGSYSMQTRSVGGVASGFSALTPTHSVVTATVTTGVLLASNVNRKHALLINDDSIDAYIKIGAPAVANQGIRLNANGGFYEMSVAFGNLVTGAINVITASGTARILATEGV